MSEAISKAKLLEWWEKYPGWIKHAFMKELESGTFDLSPTDVDMKEIEERVSWLRQNGYKTDMQETLLTKLSEYESQIGELDTAHQLMHARNERLEAELSGITEKLAVKESEYEECKADALGLYKQLGEAVEALENYARCALCGGNGYSEYPSGVEDNGIQEMMKEPCDCCIANVALQSIKGDGS